MGLYFSEQFKRLRKNHDLTQEEMAEIFHVAPQTVSRWETGVNYPDIDLLPHIAVFFKVTVDELLGTNRILSEQKVKIYKRDIRNLLNAGQVNDAILLAREAVSDFPINDDLQAHLLQALCVEAGEQHKDEICNIGEHIMRHGTDQNIGLWVKYQLIRQYAKWGMREAAKRIVDTLPTEAYFTQDLNMGLVLEGEAWVQNQKLRIIRFTIMLCDLIRSYAKKAGLDVATQITWLKAAAQIEKLTRPIQGEHSGLAVHLDDAFQNVAFAELYCEAGDTENALLCIEKATQEAIHHIDVMDRTEDDGSNYYPWETPRNLCWILWEDFLAKPRFDGIRDNERFIRCFGLLKENARALTTYAQV